jgi:hypothetical protein
MLPLGQQRKARPHFVEQKQVLQAIELDQPDAADHNVARARA